MVELIKWWNNSTVRDILRYFSNQNTPKTKVGFLTGEFLPELVRLSIPGPSPELALAKIPQL